MVEQRFTTTYERNVSIIVNVERIYVFKIFLYFKILIIIVNSLTIHTEHKESLRA